MATTRDLKDVLKEQLEKSGALKEIRARVRAEVFNILHDESEPPPPFSNENLFINELIREYLVYNGYLFTESVLVAESGIPNFPFQREFLEGRLQIKQDGETNLPLLYTLVDQFSSKYKPLPDESTQPKGQT